MVQYNRVRPSLLANNIDLMLVSIGKPDVGKKLLKHLELDQGEDWIFVDPENKLYDALQLNRGVETTFFSIETPYAFRDRLFGTNGRKDGMTDLLKVLGKWKDAVYIPPKSEQAFQQGGAFIFKGNDTVLAHYDAAAGTHIEVSLVVEKALEAAAK